MKRQNVEFFLGDQTFSGTVTDMDCYFVMGLMSPNFKKVLSEEDTIVNAFKELQEEAQAYKQSGKGQEANDLWNNRMVSRLSIINDARAAFCQRICEIIPAIDPELVYYKQYIDAQGNTFADFNMRLGMIDLVEIMIVISKAINAIGSTMDKGLKEIGKRHQIDMSEAIAMAGEVRAEAEEPPVKNNKPQGFEPKAKGAETETTKISEEQKQAALEQIQKLKEMAPDVFATTPGLQAIVDQQLQGLEEELSPV